MGIPTTEGYTPSGAASAKRGARGSRGTRWAGRDRPPPLLLRAPVRPAGAAVAEAYVSCPLCLLRSAGYRKIGVGDGPGDAGQNKRPVVQKTSTGSSRSRKGRQDSASVG